MIHIKCHIQYNIYILDTATKKPEPQIKHVYESRENAVYLARVMNQEEEQERSTTTTTMAPEVVLNAEADHNFLATRKWEE